MRDTTRMLLIALGVVLLIVVALPLLVMGGMMGPMPGGMMMGPMPGGSQCCGGGAWPMLGLGLLALLGGGLALILGLRRREGR